MGNCKSALPGAVALPARAGQRDFVGKYLPFLAAAPSLASRLRNPAVQKALVAAATQDDGSYVSLARVVLAIWDERGAGVLDHAALAAMTGALLEALLCFDDGAFNVLAGATPEEIQTALTDVRNALLRCAGLTQYTLEEHILIDGEAVAAWLEWLDATCSAAVETAAATAEAGVVDAGVASEAAGSPVDVGAASLEGAAVAIAVPETA